MPTPLLIISDAPTAGTGLGRITRDLAVRIAADIPEFKVGTLGYGGPYSSKLPFHQYQIDMQDWVILNLPEVWEDFAGDEKGVILTIWDASRLLWFSRPENCADPRLRTFLAMAPFKRWGYFPIDATGPHDRLTGILSHTMLPYQRVLAYSEWAKEILKRSGIQAEQLPHGIDTSVFKPRPKVQARHGFGQRIGARISKNDKFISIPDDALLVGIVATNQMRKDYGLGISVCEKLRETHRNLWLWIHTDELERHWSIPALLNDFGLTTNTIITTIPLSDEQMAWCYSACDVTLGIGLGEGFGYPIFESLACGTPCVHGNYGGAAEHLPERMLIDPPGFPVETPSRLEGCYNCYRPVYSPSDAAWRVDDAIKEECSLPPALDWSNLWPRWKDWLLQGLKGDECTAPHLL